MPFYTFSIKVSSYIKSITIYGHLSNPVTSIHQKLYVVNSI